MTKTAESDLNTKMIASKIEKLGSCEILRLTLTSGEKGHALGLIEAKALEAAFKNFKAQGLLFTSEGNRFFCSGGNLREQIESTRTKSLETQKRIRRALDQLSRIPVPTAAIVSGDTYGGGMELLSCFDYVVALPHVRLALWQRRLGLTFGWGGGRRLQKRLGSSRLTRSFISAQSYTAFEAERMGLVDEVVPAALAEERGLQWLVRAAQLSKKSLAAIKKWDGTKEEKIFESLWFKEDHKAALEAFAKRKR